MNDSDSVLWFGDEACELVAAAGGKGASLSRMSRLELPVPPGFVVPAAVLRQALEAAGKLEQVQGRLPQAVEAGGSALADEVRGTPIPAAAAAAILAAYESLGDRVPVAVRSSACAEDSETASFAGQQETYLNVRGGEAVLQAIRSCWASFFSERAIFYRSRKGSLDDLAMAVVVQRQLLPEKSGVMFTIDPVRRRRDQMLVEAVLGLGEAAVSGRVTPDQYLLAPDGRVKRATVGAQSVAVVALPGGGVEERQLSPAEGSARVLEDAQLAALARLGKRLEASFGGPQDVEWAIEGGHLYLLQSRPVTA